ncbi:MAG: hypothetical protein QM751_04040 [Paludibacteraceae bacterium]
MKKTNLLWVVCLITFVGATTVHAQNPTMLSPGFETDDFADVWTNYFGNLVSVVSDDHYSGTKSCKLITDAGQLSEVYQTVEITAGKAYTLSVYNKLLNDGGNGTAILGYAFLDESGSNMNEFVSVPITSTQGAWAKGSLSTIVAPAGAVYMWFDIQANGAEGTSILFDDASLTEAGAAGINEVRAQLPIRVQDGNLIVTTEAGKSVEVYSVVGAKLQSKVATSGETVISDLPQSQVLIVRSGNAVAKVVL